VENHEKLQIKENCMKNWKRWNFVAIFLLMGGAFYANAQDMIVLKDGNMIEAKVVEISSSEIRYKRFDHLDGPTIVIPAINVLSIRYENDTYEIINAGTIPQQGNIQTEQPKNTAMDPNKFTFGINANAGGALGYIWGGPSGFGINIELGKGKFNSEINIMFPTGGFGILATFNGFWPSKMGGFYLGGGIGFSSYEVYGYILEYDPYYSYNPYTGTYSGGYSYRSRYYTAISVPVGLNIGYKFVTQSGLYFRTGAFAAFDFGFIFNEDRDDETFVYFKPDLAIGWTMR
jgi:hypothetical protein